MNGFRAQLMALALGTGLALSAGAVPRGADHLDDYANVRTVVDRTQSDLRAASDLEHGGKQDSRYKNAQDHLSDFDRSLAKGHFNKDRLDRAIEDLKNLVDHNTLQASARDALVHDLEDLRLVRERHGH